VLNNSSSEDDDGVDAVPQLTIQVRDDYIHARAIGRRTRSAVASLAADIGRSAIEAGLHKILVDVRELEGWLGLFDSYFVVRDSLSALRGRGIQKAAIVDRPAPTPGERFFELTARNRGFNLRIFESLQAAIRWLAGDSDGEADLHARLAGG
jgi:hypothetical protein